ncbi:MAG: Holliday junction resolvase [Thermoplasmata archaeon]
MSGAQYERELKHILEGDKGVIEKYIKGNGLKGKNSDAMLYLVRYPFFVIRSAGSKSLDLLAVRGGLVLPIEIKSSSSETINFTDSNGRNQKQYALLVKAVRKSNLMLFYAVRLKNSGGEPWRIFSAYGMKGWAWVPHVSETKNGNILLKWGVGLALSQFLRRVNRVD